MQIVIAWAEQTKLVREAGFVTRDMNLFPKFRFDWEGKAAMWLRNGSDADVQKAEAFAHKEGHAVFTFASDERDPLGQARQKAVATLRAQSHTTSQEEQTR